MKLLSLFFFIGIGICNAAVSYSQSTALSLEVRNKTVKDVFNEIEKNSEFLFFYYDGVLDVNRRVNLDVKNQNVDKILDKLFESTDNAYTIKDRQIFISKKGSAEKNVFSEQQQAKRTITGIVTDNNNETLVGVSVVVKGTQMGVATDMNGKFKLETSQSNPVLVFSYIGYIEQEVQVGNKEQLEIKLLEDTQTLEEIVVVGYGVQKKVNLTGAVSTVSAGKLESRATTTLSSSLAGLASGVTVRQSSGKPGSDDAGIRIRGIGTFNSDYLSPLVIVDGSEASISSVNTEDVESITFLKDAASASIYRSRGANGVLLITTKKGKKGEAPKITYTGILSNTKMSGKAFRFENNYAEYMEMANRWYTNPKWDGASKFTQEDINEWREAEKKDPNGMDNPYGVPNFLAYPTTQWVDHLFLSSSTQKHNLSVIGGSTNTNYLLSFGYLDNPGTLKNTGLKDYSGRINMETQINKFLKVGTQTYATFQKRDPGDTELKFIFQNVPAVTPYYNGMYGMPVDGSSGSNLLATVVSSGGSHDKTRLNTTWYGGLNIIEGLTAELRYNYQTTFDESATYSKKVDRKNFRTGEISLGTSSENANTSRSTTRYWNNTTTATLNYLKTFGDHDFAALLGAERYYWNVKGFSARRTGLLDLDLPDFTAAIDKIDPVLGGTPEQDYGVLSYFGRLNYGYKERYLLEANFRRDGSSRFGPDYRWGTFPSFSAAWRLSEESFMQGTQDLLSNMKLRASWGQLGNTTSGYYEWQATYGSVEYSFDGNAYDGLRQKKIANPLLHWEAVTSSDIGLEVGFLGNRLTLEADYYSRTTKGILASPSVYMTMGTVSAPTTNTSDMRNQGLDLTLGWSDKINDFRYSVSANFTYNQNSIVKYKGKYKEGWETDANGNQVWVTNRGDVADVSGNTIRVDGHMYDEYYLWKRHQGNGNIYLSDGATPDPNGGPRDGMIRTKADLDWVRAMLGYVDPATGKKPYNFNSQSVGQGSGLWYGECIYADINGDGMYGTNDNDRLFTGKSTVPKYTFGLNLSAEWKGFDINMTWAGNAGMYYHIYERGFNSMSSASWQEGTIVALNARNIYYYSDPKEAATNPNYDPATDPNARVNAPYMRIGNIGAAHRNNTSELYNASYVKLKTLQLGYTFPKAWMTKAYISNLRLFVSGENLFTITDFPGVDPEIGGAGFQSYPIPRMFSGGINISF